MRQIKCHLCNLLTNLGKIIHFGRRLVSFKILPFFPVLAFPQINCGNECHHGFLCFKGQIKHLSHDAHAIFSSGDLIRTYIWQ